jgi:hypothetical protein
MLDRCERIVFLTLFWGLMLVIMVIKIVMILFSVGYVLDSPPYSQDVDCYLHLGYYLSIAMVELVSVVYLVRKFRAVLRSSKSFLFRGGRLYLYLMRSTEIRLVMLMFIGVMRTITASVGTFVSQQEISYNLDQFIYTLECLFPVVM